MRINWLPRARNARSVAIAYIAKDNPSAALRQLDEIEKQIALLAQFPDMGRPGRVKNTREQIINRTPFILIYQLDGDTLKILHFLHGAQQWPPQ